MNSIQRVLAIATAAVLTAGSVFAQSPENISGNTVSIMDLELSGQFKPGMITPTRILDIDRTVGEQVCFTLTAKDKNGNVIRSWNTTGQATTITLKNSTANTDTSNQTWNSDPEGYSFAKVLNRGVELTKISADEWSIPASSFDDNGQAEICLIHTKAEQGVYLEITPIFVGLNQQSAKMNFKADVITNFLVEITPQTAQRDQVFHMRPYEIVVSPRDKYLNVNTETIQARFTARFPGEFDSNQPGLADIFSGDVFISGVTNYLVASRIKRELQAGDQLQWIMTYASANQNIRGRTDDYEILTHAPTPFALQQPPDQFFMTLVDHVTLENFTWERPNPPDPYTNIVVSRFGVPTPVSDVVTYTWTIVDSISLTRAVRIASDNGGDLPLLTMSQGQIRSVMETITSDLMHGFVWFVEATDGLYQTLSTPPNNDPNQRPGHRLTIYKLNTGIQSVITPTTLRLGQNYPNPFNPTTTIVFGIPTSGEVTLKVYDLIGTEIATVVNQRLDAGEHTVMFDSENLRSGTYLYKLQFQGNTLTRRMTLLK